VRTAYQGPLGGTIGVLVTAFAPFGFSLSAPVFEHFDNPDCCARKSSTTSSTACLPRPRSTPRRSTVIQQAYRVGAHELAEARAILSGDKGGAFALNGSMCEPATHGAWANSIVKRAGIYGVRPEGIAAAV
jgi:citrate lyase beta subunit